MTDELTSIPMLGCSHATSAQSLTSCPCPYNCPCRTHGSCGPGYYGDGTEFKSPTDDTLPKETQKTVSEWSQKRFGHCSPPAAAARVNQEMAELLAAVARRDTTKASEEIADVIICLYRLASILGSDVQEEIDKKMTINRRRKWKVASDGTAQHIPEGED